MCRTCQECENRQALRVLRTNIRKGKKLHRTRIQNHWYGRNAHHSITTSKKKKKKHIPRSSVSVRGIPQSDNANYFPLGVSALLNSSVSALQPRKKKSPSVRRKAQLSKITGLTHPHLIKFRWRLCQPFQVQFYEPSDSLAGPQHQECDKHS